MRTELFSVRSSTDEVALLNRELRTIVTDLDNKASIRVLFKTEIDCNTRVIKNDLMSSLASDNPPELYIYANALCTKDSSSFRKLFTPVVERIEKELPEGELAEDGKTRLYPNIKVYPITELGEYPAYCFTVQNRKVLVLPRISLVGENLSDYLCKAVNCAKEIFSRAFTECPSGYIYLPREPKFQKLRAMFFKKSSENNAEEIKDEVAKTPVTASADKEETTEKPAETTESSAADNTEAQPEKSKKKAKDKAEDKASEEVKEEKAEVKEEAPDASEDDGDKTSDTETPENEASDKKKKKGGFKAFIKSFIPMKGDDKKTIITKSVVLLAIAGFLVAGGMLLDFYVIEPWINDRNINEIKEVFYSDTVVTDQEGNVVSTGKTRNWEGLKKINKEIVGWIRLDGAKIDYPVLFHKEDSAESQFYLYRNYKKEPSDFGSVFLDYRCPKGTDSKQIVLHGHNMSSDGSMFSDLLKYARVDGWTKGNIKYYQANPIIHFDTPKSDGEWIIFSVMKINVSNKNEAIFNYFMGDFESEAQFMNYVYNVKERSYINVNIPINEDDQLITLSTCSYEQENNRTVIVARRVREDENIDKYVKKAKEHTPDNNPTSTFSEQLEAKKIKWYDGDGKLDGNEEIEFLEPAKVFTVKFVDAKGKTIVSQKVMEGEDATAPTGEAPRKAADGTYYYTFKGWDRGFTNVTSDLTIKPLFSKHKMKLPKATTRATATEEEETKAPPTTQKKPVVTNPPATAAPVTTDPPEPATTQ
ncbi:MAG: sortase [Clostridia bacterium]|nr:sortase [Clostridia bacterium]